MKKKRFKILSIVCLLLSVSLVVTIVSLGAAKSDVALLEAQVAELGEKNKQLEELTQSLRNQLTVAALPHSGDFPAESYCTLYVDNWSVSGDVLNIDAYAQAFLTSPMSFTSKIEIWKDDTVLISRSIVLEPGESSSVYEAAASVQFDLPQLAEGEEIELWLMVAPTAGTPLFSCAAGWYLDNGQLMLIAG